MHPYQSSPVEPNQAYQFAQLSNLLLHIHQWQLQQHHQLNQF